MGWDIERPDSDYAGYNKTFNWEEWDLERNELIEEEDDDPADR